MWQFDGAAIDVRTQCFPAQLAAVSRAPLGAVETALLEVFCPQFLIAVIVFIALSYFLNCFSQCCLLPHLICPLPTSGFSLFQPLFLCLHVLLPLLALMLSRHCNYQICLSGPDLFLSLFSATSGNPPLFPASISDLKVSSLLSQKSLCPFVFGLWQLSHLSQFHVSATVTRISKKLLRTSWSGGRVKISKQQLYRIVKSGLDLSLAGCGWGEQPTLLRSKNTF